MWAYHATRVRDLKKISRVGLLPKRQPARHADESRATKKKVLFFAPTEDMAAIWNEVVLRFLWPTEYEEDYYGDSMLVDGEVLRSSYFTSLEVPFEEIQIKVRGRWRYLVEL